MSWQKSQLYFVDNLGKSPETFFKKQQQILKVTDARVFDFR